MYLGLFFRGSPHFLQQNCWWLSSCTEWIFSLRDSFFASQYLLLSEREEAIVFTYKSDTIMLATLLFGFIVCVPFIPHCSDWSSFDWNVLSSWKETTVFDLHLSIGGSTLGRAFIASSVGALVMCRKLIFTILWRNNLQYSHVWPLMSINKNALFRMQWLVQCHLPRYWHCRWEKGLWMVSSFRRCNRSLAAILQRRVVPAFGSIALRNMALAPHLIQNVWQLDPWCHIWTQTLKWYVSGMFCTQKNSFLLGLMTFNE